MKTEKLQQLPFKNWSYDFLFVAGLLMILSSFYFFDDKMLFPEYPGFLPCVGSAFIIYSGDRAKSAIILRWKPIVGIGLISYSLYLIHWPIIVFWHEVQSIGLDFAFGRPQVSTNAAFIIAIVSFGLAYLSYKYIEQPFRKPDVLKKRKIQVSFGLILIMIFGFATSVKASRGWPWRVSQSVVKFDENEDIGIQQRNWLGAGEGGPMFTDKPADIVLIGDSHAGHYAEGLYQEWAKPYNLALYNSSANGCFHLPGMTQVENVVVNFDTFCPEMLATDLSFIRQGNTPVVIVAHHWLMQLNEAGLLDEDGKRINKKPTFDDIRHKLQLLKKMISPSKLVVIGSSHILVTNLYDLATRPNTPFLYKPLPKDLLTTRLDQKIVDFNHKLADAAKQDCYLFLDPTLVLCKDRTCKNIDENGYLLFADSNHLTNYGSRYVIRAFLPELKKLRESPTIPNKL